MHRLTPCAVLIISILEFLLASGMGRVEAVCDGGSCIYLSKDEVAAAAYGAGFRGGGLVYSIAVSDAESSFALNAINHNTTGTIDHGLWQINTYFHPKYIGHENDLLYNASYNAAAAYSIFSNTPGGPSFCQWATFWQGTFKQFLDIPGPARTAAQAIDSTVIRPINQEFSRVRATSDVHARATAGGSLLRTVTAGTTGTVLDGPQVQSFGTCPNTNPHYYAWWKIHWDDGGADGWSVEDALARISASPASCHLYTSSSFSTPHQFTTGFGVPWNFFTTPKNELVLKASCSATGVTAQIHKPSSIQDHYIYHIGHQWNDTTKQWEQFIYQCSEPLIANAWCNATAHAPLNPTRQYFIAYACSWVGNQWKCGCRDQACTAGYWQLQKFQH